MGWLVDVNLFAVSGAAWLSRTSRSSGWVMVSVDGVWGGECGVGERQRVRRDYWIGGGRR